MRNTQAEPKRKGRVAKDYQAQFADPIAVEAGEAFTVSERAEPWENNPAWMWVWCTDQRGKSGWVPKALIHVETDGRTGTTPAAYSARELTVTAGQELVIELEESGWFWCCDQQGTYGWVPISHMRQDRGKYEQAEILYKQVLATREKLWGSEHPETKRARKNLNMLQQERKQRTGHS